MGTLMSSSGDFLFHDCAGEKEKLEKAIVYCLRQKQIENKAELVTIKSGMAFFGSKNQCLRVRIDKTAYVTISCINVGSFLYVSVFREEKTGMFANSRRQMTADDVFKQQQQDAVYCAILACCNLAFEMLQIADKQVKE